VAVIGAGAAGLLAGIAAAQSGAHTVVYERNAAPGRKLALTGGGRCNYSNTLAAREFVARFGDPHAAHLGHALRAFSRNDLEAVLKRHGLEGRVEEGSRLFIRSGGGQALAQALRAELEASGAVLELDAQITDLRLAHGALVAQPPAAVLEGRFTAEAWGHSATVPPVASGTRTAGDQPRLAGAQDFVLDGRFHGAPTQRRARTVVLCTGGLSYPQTGSTGDGFAWARALGHTLAPLRPGLAGLMIAEEWPRNLPGLSWPDAEVRLYPLHEEPGAAPSSPGLPRRRPGAPGRALAIERGAVLFAHFGLSGPAILDLSNAYARSAAGPARLVLDFFPTLPAVELDGRLEGLLRSAPRRRVSAVLAALLPGRLSDHFCGALGWTELPAARISNSARRRLARALKETALTVTDARDIRSAEITVGGVAWAEAHPATLESKLVRGLFLAGEVLDLAGRCGGFNLQAAFSTGFLAGRSAARRACREDH
jgi:predicted flavoprotein YhiN